MVENDQLRLHFSRASRLLARGGWKRVGLQLDDAEREFELAWDKIYSEFQNRPLDAKLAAAQLIDAQPMTSALTLAIAKTDAVELFSRFKRLLEFILVKTERLSGYPAVRSIPHVQAGFLYMTASVMALRCEAWGVLDKLLTSKFEWYYQSGRAIFSYPFEMSYFFHSEAFGRSANKIHDFFREKLASPDFANAMQLAGEGLLDAYTQTQMLMSLRVAQLHERGEAARIWPDFGRFYAHRVVRLLDRAYNDSEFGTGVLRAFGEDRETFFSHLNQRLNIISSIFFTGAPFLYESLESWEPRETHA